MNCNSALQTLSAALSLLPSPSWMKISILYLNPDSCNTFLRPSSNSPGASLFHYPFLQSSRQFSVLFAVLVFMVLVSYDFYFFFFGSGAIHCVGYTTET